MSQHKELATTAYTLGRKHTCSKCEHSNIPCAEDRAKTCCICGALIVKSRCASCGHSECSNCPYWVSEPNRDELKQCIARLEADKKALLEALEGILAITDRKHDAWDKAHAAIAQARK